jgi:hypothetical protein
MTRKDYELIANSIRHQYDAINVIGDERLRRAKRSALFGLAESLARDLKADNHRFDAGRFIEACFGVE